MREGAIWWAVSGSVLSAAVFIVARLYQINEKAQVVLNVVAEKWLKRNYIMCNKRRKKWCGEERVRGREI